MTAATKTKRRLTDAEIISAWSPDEREAVLSLCADPVLFCQVALGFDPNPAQKKVLTADPPLYASHTILDWGRQFGKSVIAGAILVYYMVTIPGFRAFVMSPSGKQSNHIMEYVQEFLGKCQLPIEWRRKGDTIYIGNEPEQSQCTLIRTGLTGAGARGASTKGKKSLLVWDEFGSYHYQGLIRSTTARIGDSSRSGELIVSSPTYVGSDYHKLCCLWSALESEAQERGDTVRYRVIPCKWSSTTHIDRERMRESYQEAKTLGRVSEWRREHGAWVQASNAWFPESLIRSCEDPTIPPLTKGDTSIWSMDLGGRRSPAVILLSRFNSQLGRIEVSECLSYVIEGNRYAKAGEHQVLTDHIELVDVCQGLRRQYGAPSLFYWDPNVEHSLGETLQSTGFPMEPIGIRSHDAKVAELKALERAMAEQRIVWKDPCISDELRAFAPQLKDTGKWDFPDHGYDRICCLGFLCHWFADNASQPFAVMRTKTWDSAPIQTVRLNPDNDIPSGIRRELERNGVLELV